MYTVLLVTRQATGELKALLEGTLDAQATVAVFSSLSEIVPGAVPGEAVLALLDGEAIHSEEIGSIRMLKKVHPGLRVILTFAMSQRDLAAQAIRCGADAYILEPYYISEFAHFLRREFADALQRHRRILDLRMDSLASMVECLAPEINNPLTTIRGFLQILLAGKGEGMSPAEIAEIYGLMDNESSRIIRIIRELEDFSRTRKPKRLPVDLHALLEQAAAEVRAESQTAVPVSVSADNCPRQAMLDQRQSLAALKSLARFLLAAADPKKSEVKITAGRSRMNGFITIAVEGSETVCLEQDLHKLFIPLFSRRIVRFQDELGLASAYGIIRGHGGTISVAPVERGTRFVIEIPSD